MLLSITFLAMNFIDVKRILKVYYISKMEFTYKVNHKKFMMARRKECSTVKFFPLCAKDLSFFCQDNT